DDLVVGPGRPHLDRDGSLPSGCPLDDVGLDEHSVFRVVLELQVNAGPGHGGLSTRGVTIDEETMWLVEHVLQPREEHRVVRSCRTLRDSATELLEESSVLDDEALGEAVGRGSLTDDPV